MVKAGAQEAWLLTREHAPKNVETNARLPTVPAASPTCN